MSGSSFGIPIAAAMSVTERGSSLTPVSRAVRPRQTERNSGTTKKKPPWTRNWKKNIVRPPVSCRFRSIVGRTSGSPPRSATRVSQRKKTQITNSPASMSQMDGDIPAQEGPPSFGWIQPHSPALRTPNTNRASPVADSSDPTQSRRGCFFTGASAIRRENSRIPIPITTSPANTQRHEK